MVLDKTVYVKGKCFICGNSCEEYAHYECALAYDEMKRKKLKEAEHE